MTSPRILFVYNRARSDRFAACEAGQAPDDALYGLRSIRGRGYDATFDDIGHDIRGIGSVYKRIDDTLSGGGKRIGFHWWQAKRLLPRLREADLVFATADSSALPILWLRKRGAFRAPVVYSSIGLTQSFPENKGPLFRWYRSLAQSAERVIAFSEIECEELVGKFGISRDCVRFVPFGVDTGFYQASEAGEGPALAFGLDPQRDWVTLAEATRSISSTIDVLAIPDHLEHVNIPKNWNLSAPVDYSELSRRLARASFIILPVRENPYTGATISLLSAMACGKAVIVSRTSALVRGYDLVDNENVVFVQPGNAAALRDAVLRLVGNPALCAALGERARDHVAGRFSIDQMADRFAGIFREVLA